MPKSYVIALGSGWSLETATIDANLLREPAYCYLVYHGRRYGRIGARACVFIEISDDVPGEVVTLSRKKVAENRDEIEATYEYNSKYAHNAL